MVISRRGCADHRPIDSRHQAGRTGESSWPLRRLGESQPAAEGLPGRRVRHLAQPAPPVRTDRARQWPRRAAAAPSRWATGTAPSEARLSGGPSAGMSAHRTGSARAARCVQLACVRVPACAVTGVVTARSSRPVRADGSPLRGAIGRYPAELGRSVGAAALTDSWRRRRSFCRRRRVVSRQRRRRTGERRRQTMTGVCRWRHTAQSAHTHTPADGGKLRQHTVSDTERTPPTRGYESVNLILGRSREPC